MKKFFYSLLILLALGGIASCGSQDGTTITQTQDGTVVDAVGYTVTLSSGVGGNEMLAQRGSTSVTAYVTNSLGEPAEGYEVTFLASAGTITETVSSVAGQATATYFAGTAGGRISIKAGTFAFIASDGTLNSSGAQDELIITVASGPAAAFEIVSIAPQRLGLKGSGSNEVATLTFRLTDSAGNPVADGQTIDFSLDAPTGGAEFLSSSSTPTIDGEAFVLLASGSVAGVATVTASTETTTGTIATEARVTMGYSKPDQKHIGIAAETLNVPGLVTFGLENKITAYIADRFSNPVPAGTPVYFASECGIMALEDIDGIATNLTSNFGIASATSITAAPASDLCRMLIWTEGEEAFTDSNGNGMYDTGEPHEGIGEPYIDANDNSNFDSEELYFDLDGNGQYTAANTTWDNDTFVWTSQNVLWSGNTAAPVITPSSFELKEEESVSFTYTVSDVNGNPLPGGTSISASSDCNATTLIGDTSVTLAEVITPGPGTTNFKLTLIGPSPAGSFQLESCSLTVSVTSDSNGNAQKAVAGKTIEAVP